MMKRHLLIDIGNTSAKIAVAEDGEVVHFERLEQSWTETFERLMQSYDIESVRLCSVAQEDLLLKEALKTLDIPVIWLTYNSRTIIKNVPEGFGADRLAADIGAFSQRGGGTTLVVDAGTCITYDILSADGSILGGAISPGVQLRLKAMHEHTALLPLFEAEKEAPLIGNDTKTAMMSAAVNGARFEIEGYIREIRRQYPDLKVFVTGGNIFGFSQDLREIVVYDPFLVFKGLYILQE